MPAHRQAPHMAEILVRLHAAYPDAVCELNHKNAFELLVATILSAQCTDRRVNLVTPALFARYPDAPALAAAALADVEALVRSTNFFRTKAKNLVAMAHLLCARHHGAVPDTLEALIALPGVARKTANVVLGVGFGQAVGVVVDTHVMRLAARLGLSSGKGAAPIERDLMAKVPQAEWIGLSMRLILHGRRVCIARRPACTACSLAPVCPSAAPEAEGPGPERRPVRASAPARKRGTTGATARRG